MTLKADIRDRVTFLGYTEEDRALLSDLRPVLERHADTLVAAFYRHLLSFPQTRRLLTDSEVKERLLHAQREYLLSLCGPEIDEAYYADRRRIGDAHERVGLEPRWYLGAYSLYASLLLPLICETHAENPELAERTVGALMKIAMLDAQIAMESYIAKREEQLEYANRELEALTRRLSRQVEDTGTALRATRRRAQTAEELAAVGTVVAGLAHEIGTPMGVIQGHAELLEKAAGDDRSRWRARAIGEQVERISNIIQTLLNLARPREPVRQPVDLVALVEKTLSFLGEKLQRRGVEVERRFDEIPSIWGDDEKLQQLFLNLFLNAIDAMPDGGKLFVALQGGEDGQVAVTVRDDGVGMGADALERIFEPFYTTKEAGRGSGLGLMVARGIVRDHDGEIRASSEAGRGTEFRIDFRTGDH